MTKNRMSAELTTKERLVVKLIMFVIKMLEPYEYEHQFKAFYEDISKEVNSKSQGK